MNRSVTKALMAEAKESRNLDDILKVNYKKLLSDKRVISFISNYTGSDPEKVWKKVRRFNLALKRFWIPLEGISSVAKRLKLSEKSFLLTGDTSWFSRRYLSGEGITSHMVKVLLSIHKNMTCKPKIDLNSVKHKSGDVDGFIARYSHFMSEILDRGYFKIKSYDYNYYTTRPGSSLRTYWSKQDLNPYTCDPTVDINSRTDGRAHPLQVSCKGRANGSCFDTHPKDLCALLRSPQLANSISYLWTEWLLDFNFPLKRGVKCKGSCNCRTGFLYPIPDKSCKTRVVAILDSFSQIALRPLHNMLDSVLHKLYYKGYDFTFSQTDGIKKLLKINSMMHSIDLSNATDTMPVALSMYILRKIIPNGAVSDIDEFVRHVTVVLTDREFYLDEENPSVRYTTGQPMGAYASFPLLAITNHLLVQLAYRISQDLYPSDIHVGRMGYAVVGDDVVIGNTRVAKIYTSLLEELGVPINHSKTISGLRTFEFCKRIVRNGVIVSVPSWNSYYTPIVTGNPTPLLQLSCDYGMRPHDYQFLLRYFKPRYIRTALSFKNFTILNSPPSVKLIPEYVKKHADNLMIIREALNLGRPEKIVGGDRFIRRLNYNLVIYDIFYNSIYSDNRDWWTLPIRVRANSFYLSYIKSYKDRKFRIPSYGKIRQRLSRSLKLRALCMSYKNRYDEIKALGCET
jgi:hypothetical protein